MSKKPIVIAIGSQKGGCGKTTTSVNIAAMANSRGLSAAVFDLDPQGSALIWGSVRGNEDITVTGAQYMYLSNLIATAAEHDVDVIVMDIPPKASDAALAGFKYADLILIPMVPEVYDMGALSQAVELTKVYSKPFYVFINKAPQVGSETLEAKEWAEGQGYNVAPQVIHARKPIAQAQALGLGAEEYYQSLVNSKEARSHHANAAKEMVDFYDWVVSVSGIGQGAEGALAKSA